MRGDFVVRERKDVHFFPGLNGIISYNPGKFASTGQYAQRSGVQNGLFLPGIIPGSSILQEAFDPDDDPLLELPPLPELPEPLEPEPLELPPEVFL